MSDDDLDLITPDETPSEEPDEPTKEGLKGLRLGEAANEINFKRWARPVGFVVICVYTAIAFLYLGLAGFHFHNFTLPTGFLAVLSGAGLLGSLYVIIRYIFSRTPV